MRQYNLVQDSRERVLNHLETLPDPAYIGKTDHLPKGSLRNLQVHIANTYIFWLNYVYQKPASYFQPDKIADIQEMRTAFEKVDAFVSDFLDQFGGRPDEIISGKVPGYETHIEATPLKLFTHLITHEFHHKGQMMSMSRKLGYPAPDTDIIHF